MGYPVEVSAGQGDSPASPTELDTLWRWGLRPRARGLERAPAIAAGAAVFALTLPAAVDWLGYGLVGAMQGEGPGPAGWSTRGLVAIVTLALVFAAAAVAGAGLSRNLGVARPPGRGELSTGPSEPAPIVGPVMAVFAVLCFAVVGAGLVASAARTVDASEAAIAAVTTAWAWRLAGAGLLIAVVVGLWQRAAVRRSLAALGPWVRRHGARTRRR